MNNKRALLLGLLSAAILPSALCAQGRVHRICWLSAAALRTEAYNVAFIDQLRKLGFVEGKNLAIEFRTAQGSVARYPELTG